MHAAGWYGLDASQAWLCLVYGPAADALLPQGAVNETGLSLLHLFLALVVHVDLQCTFV